ncbi:MULTISPECIES: transglycosylase domain-containing protein [unclassified Bacillus (in: firmicutes)]|uniref:transglycosylase domain-containing protein n=1 Tax=unclassified Bacillus (in: firmicutes) TaxID=185979 RepID=UPI0008E2AE3B|nr:MULTISPECIES: PBP1A family penicillin-binding protein [unclassified Bacillus (in: firmicutes)]SFB13379.1 penicillin-binding protein 2A [Bacillus sp. UNCCL13]SFQ90031.1 penicillin-binding protein 2A [Bacillus sp. cl95]
MERQHKYLEAFVRFWKRKHFTQYILLISLTVLLFTILYFAVIAGMVDVKSLKAGLSQSTVVYDKDGDVATYVGTNRTKGVEIKTLPKHVPNAVVAIEDERFYEHSGFDVKGIARALFGNIFAGRITGGGSTLTQQLTKNALLSSERSYRRKAEELFLAVKIEKTYTKDEILQMYLNQVYFGSGAWGIAQASQRYFDKDISEVTISEAALLGGLLQSPSYLNPYNNYDRAIKRRNLVLMKMNEHGMISDQEYKDAKNEKIKLRDGGGSLVKRKYPYYVDAALDEAIKRYGLTQDEILTRGYRIYTEMDQNLQGGLEQVYQRNSLFPGRSVQSGAVLLDPASGGVRGLVGGRGETVFRGFNRATHIKAQPGSTLKPLAVYTPALEEGYNYNSNLIDKPLTFDNYKPENFSKTYAGEVPMYEAVEKSLNIPAVWLLDQIGLNKGLDSLKRFGIPIQKEDKNLGIALGGMYNGISPLQLAEAYSAFPNEGKREDAHIITKIVGPTGNIIAEHDSETVKVTSRSVANKMTSMLLNVVETGTGKRTKISGVDIAGKTGSTQLPYKDIDGTKDQWFVGYTPNLVGAVWLGYDKTDRQHYLSTSSSETVVPIFRAIMERSLDDVEPAEFDVDSVNTILAGKSDKAATEKIRVLEEELKQNADKVGGKLKEEAPKWKEKIDATIIKMIENAGRLKDKLQQITQ